jgi:hypothetical protein
MLVKAQRSQTCLFFINLLSDFENAVYVSAGPLAAEAVSSGQGLADIEPHPLRQRMRPVTKDSRAGWRL